MILEFETNELLIRKIELSDVAAIYQNWAQQIEVCRYTTWTPHESPEETRRYVENCLQGWDHGSFTWMIERKRHSELVGSFAARKNDHKVDVGYLLGMNWWGKGFMTSVLVSFISEAFKVDTVERIGAVCDVENPASKRVMEKAGMQYEGVLFSWIVHPNMGTKPRDCHSLCITRDCHFERL